MNRVILTDGAPLYLKMAEEYLVGGALLASRAEVQAINLSPRDFRDTSLGAIWTAIKEVPSDPTWPLVAARLNERGWIDSVGGEPRLVDLSGAVVLLYGGLPWLQAHASIVKDWSTRRAILKQASETAKAAYEGKVKHSGGVSLDYDVAE
jgi:replicative DNA helicase